MILVVLTFLFGYFSSRGDLFAFLYVNFLLPISLFATSPLVDVRRSLGPIPLFNILLLLSALFSLTLFSHPTFLLFLPLITGLSYIACRIFDKNGLGTTLLVSSILVPGFMSEELRLITLCNLLTMSTFEIMLRYTSILESKILGKKYQIFRAFLDYILANSSERLEKILEEVSGGKEKLRVYSIMFTSTKGELKGVLIIPYIHPGPFRDFGSSALPSRIMEAFRERGIPALVFHGPSSHERDLIYKSHVETITNHLLSRSFDEIKHVRVSCFYRKNSKNFTLFFTRMDSYFLAFASSIKNGIEDLPYEIVVSLSHEIPDRIMLVDAHNRLDLKGGNPRPLPGTSLYSELIDLIKTSYTTADLPIYDEIKAGFYSTRINNIAPDSGIGAGGVAAAAMDIDGKRYFLITFDGNNMINPLRDHLIQKIKEELGFHDGEIATTDTHTVAGIAPNKSYSPLGEKIPLRDLEEITISSLQKALDKMSDCRITIGVKDFHLPVLGDKTIEKLFDLTSKSLKALAAAICFSLLLGFPLCFSLY